MVKHPDIQPTSEHLQSREQAVEAGAKKRIAKLERKLPVTSQLEQVTEARAEVAKAAKEVVIPEPEAEPKATHINRSTQKKTAYAQTMRRITQSLPRPAARVFSKLIHQPVIERVSEISGKTIFRPSLTLGMSLGALLGGSTFYVMAERYGFSLSGSEFMVSALLGGVAGLVFETTAVLLRKVMLHRSL